MNPITRQEIFLAAASGEGNEIPEPITREEMYLKKIAENGGGGGTGGTTNYNALSNKPKINSVELSGNKSLADLGIPTKTSQLTNDDNVVKDASYVHTDNNYDATAKNIVDGVSAALSGKVDNSKLGAINGVAQLGEDGKLLSSQMPGSIDYIKEAYYNDDDGKFYEEATYETEITPQSSVIYVSLDTNKTYRWSGTQYVEISESLALGETAQTAYPGNKGKANADAISGILDGTNIDSFGDAETALSGKINTTSRGAANGVAGLDANGKVPTTQLPDLLGLGETAQTAYAGDKGKANADAITAIKDGANIDSFADVETALGNKADKVSGATNNNFAALDASGNLKDSGKKASDFASAEAFANNLDNNGSKNMVVVTENSQTKSSVVFTRNADNSWTVNGSGNSNYILINASKAITLKANKTYTFSGGYNNNLKLELVTSSNHSWYTDKDGNQIKTTGTAVTFTNGSVDKNVYVTIRLDNNVSTNATVYPMLCLATDYAASPTYEPYAKTNRQLTEDSVDWESNSVLGAKNFLHTDGSQITQGVLFECDENGVFTVTRQTASSNHAYYSNGRFTLKPGTYIFSNGYDSLPSGIQATYLYNHTDGVYFTNCNNGPKAFSLTAEKELAFNIEVQSSQSPSNVKIYPMIRLASDNDATYQPYTKTNQELTKDSVDWDDFNKVGAINLLPNNKAVGTTTSTDGHVTWTVNADGSVTINADGQQTADTPFVLCSASQWEKQPSGRYRLSGCPSGGSTTTYYLQTQMKDGSGSNVTMVDYGNSKVSSFDQNVSMATNGNIFITVCKNTVVNNITFYPMFARIGYKGSYVPYARTNKELTDIANKLLFGGTGVSVSAVTDLNTPLTSQGGASFNVSRFMNNTTNAPYTGGGLVFTWASSASYGAQLVLGNAGFWFRGNTQGTISAWQKLTT